MDVLTAMYDHHIATTSAILDRLDAVGADVLDRPISVSVEGIDDAPTLRNQAERLVRQLEMWVSAVDGGTEMPTGAADPAGLRDRLAVAEPAFRTRIVDRVADGRADETFVDTICDPPRTFSPAGVLAHVLTFAAVRRTFAIGALADAGVDDLGSGDPMVAVGGAGDDASRITRHRAD